jgi:diacylglycerol kinase family enzyme
MNGRFYGGGMMPTPEQDRLSDDGRLSLLVFHRSGKLKTLMVFPSLFKGEHVKHTKIAEVLTGYDISVEFDRPTALQIDGETVTAVSSYRARAHSIE